MGAIRHEVIRPDMVSMGRPKTNTGSVIKPETPTFRLLLGNLESLLPPDPLHPLVVDPKTPLLQKSCNPTIPISTVFAGQTDNLLS
jgi:hypothetical protein